MGGSAPPLEGDLRYTDVAALGYYSMAVRSDGQVVAFGTLPAGIENVYTPPPGVAYTAAAAGPDHILLLRSDGQIDGFGSNDQGRAQAPALPDSLRYTAIAAGSDYSMALRSDGQVVSFGATTHRPEDHLVPEPGTRYVEIAAGARHALVLRSDGQVEAFSPHAEKRELPPAPPAGLTYVGLAAGKDFSLALRSDGEAVVFASTNSRVNDVPPLSDQMPVVGVVGGESSSTIVRADGSSETFGVGPFENIPIGQLLAAPPGTSYTHFSGGGYMNGVMAVRSDGKVVYGEHIYDDYLPEGRYTAVAQGYAHTLALRSDGQIVAKDWYGSSQHLIEVPALPEGVTYTDVSANLTHSLALRSDGQVVAFGKDEGGRLDVPPLPEGMTYTAISAGDDHSLLLRSDGRVVGFGGNFYGQSDAPDLPPGMAYTAISAGERHSMALRSDGQLVTFGSTSAAPPLPDGMVYTAISAGARHSLALRTRAQSGAAPEIAGSGLIGTTLAATHRAMDGASVGYQWYADHDAIAGATSATLAVTPELLGRKIRVTTTARLSGYPEQSLVSTPVLAQGTQEGGAPAIDGTPTVDTTLTAIPNAMPGAVVSYQWHADGHDIAGATEATLEVSADLVGQAISVTTRATLANHLDLEHTSEATSPVTEATFREPSVAIAGVAQVGETLEAVVTAAPDPSATSLEWLRGSDVVATGDSYTLVKADQGHQISVRATLERPGYLSATVAAASAVVASDTAPGVTLTGTDALRLGEHGKVSWSVSDADAEGDTISGSWTDQDLPTTGTFTTEPTTTGRQTYTVTATNAAGTTTATHITTVTLPKVKIKVTSARKRVGSGKKVRIKATGLAPREAYTLRAGGTRRRGNADARGVVRLKVTAPVRFKKGTRMRVTVTGAMPDRTGATRLRVKAVPVKVAVARRTVRASDPQTVIITGLAPRERFSLTVDGTVIHRGRAGARGNRRHTHVAGTAWGTERVRVVAHRTKRSAATTYRVGRRCADGVWRCP